MEGDGSGQGSGVVRGVRLLVAGASEVSLGPFGGRRGGSSCAEWRRVLGVWGWDGMGAGIEMGGRRRLV